MISDSDYSYARAVLGIRFDPKSISNINTVVSGRGNYKIIRERKGQTSHIVEINKKAKIFLRLS